MRTSSRSSPDSQNNSTTPSTLWSFLSAPIAGNASFLAGSLHWLAIAFKWFLNLILIFLAVGVVLGIGSLIFGSLNLYPIRRGDESKGSGDGDRGGGLDAGMLTELELRSLGYDEEDEEGCSSESDEEI